MNGARKGLLVSTVAIISGVVTAMSPLFIAVFTWIVNRRINQRTAQDTALTLRLEQQREDFNSIMAPLQVQVENLTEANAALTARVSALGDRLDSAVDDRRYLVYDFLRTRHYFQTTYNDTGPVVTERTLSLLGRENDD